MKNEMIRELDKNEIDSISGGFGFDFGILSGSGRGFNIDFDSSKIDSGFDIDLSLFPVTRSIVGGLLGLFR